ncbi:MAG: carboxypeptidase-like regulatory domain-containing protein, partial [Bacteroides sp.]|nr:carboxypeptidase-like regulatory domain-containing protein [Bacteroides sp.]
DRKRRLQYGIHIVLAIMLFSAWSIDVVANQSTGTLGFESDKVSQAIPVTGIVMDVNGEAVIGASVMENGTTNGTITDVNGRYNLNVNSGAILVISYVGYQTQEIRATANMRVILKEDSELLDEIVVVGYGSQKRENLTGAVATVDVERTLSGRPIADVGRGLQGTTPGLSIVIPSGEVGSDPTIKIRGQLGSIDGKSDPLILLDNVEIPSIQMINPDDIESISVLKDAASASIYGAKAAFGVVLITTKKEQKQKV